MLPPGLNPVTGWPLLVVVGPSCAGKSTLAFKAAKSSGLALLVHHTSRQRREGEPEDAYRFVARSRFKQMIKAGELAHHSVVHGEWYGLSRKELARAQAVSPAGGICVLNAEGLRQARALPGVAAVGVYLRPPEGIEEQRQRILDQRPDSELRLRSLAAEQQAERACDWTVRRGIEQASPEAAEQALRFLYRSSHPARPDLNTAEPGSWPGESEPGSAGSEPGSAGPAW